MGTSANVILGVLCLITGLIFLRRGMREEPFPSPLISLFSKPEVQSDKDRSRWIRSGVLNLMLGAFWIIFAVFSRHR